MSARFGPAGNAADFPYKTSERAPAWIAAQGLDCYEYQCGKGVHVGEETCRRLGENARAAGIALSLHAPYFINLANPDREALQKTIGYITAACLAAGWMGAERVVIHSGALMKRTRRQALDTALASLREVVAACDDQGFGHIALCPETMGKINQLGDLNEVITLCNVDERIWPTVDFGHLHCRGLGSIKSKQDYADILDRLENGIGTERAKTMHVHFSRIEYTKGGEKMHHTFADTQYGPEFMPLAELVAERDYSPVFICESKGTMAEDAKAMKDMYFSAAKALLK